MTRQGDIYLSTTGGLFTVDDGGLVRETIPGVPTNNDGISLALADDDVVWAVAPEIGLFSSKTEFGIKERKPRMKDKALAMNWQSQMMARSGRWGESWTLHVGAMAIGMCLIEPRSKSHAIPLALP